MLQFPAICHAREPHGYPPTLIHPHKVFHVESDHISALNSYSIETFLSLFREITLQYNALLAFYEILPFPPAQSYLFKSAGSFLFVSRNLEPPQYSVCRHLHLEGKHSTIRLELVPYFIGFTFSQSFLHSLIDRTRVRLANMAHMAAEQWIVFGV